MITFFILVFVLSFDTFMAALSYEGANIKIPFSSNFIISFICSFSLFVSLFFGHILSLCIPITILKKFSFLLLFGIGIFKIFDNFIKDVCFKSKKSNLLLQIYADYKKADKDKSNVLSNKESLFLALVLSIDSLGTGIVFNLNLNNMVFVFIFSLLINICFICISKLGGKILSKMKIDFSLVSGFIFIILAFFRA